MGQPITNARLRNAALIMLGLVPVLLLAAWGSCSSKALTVSEEFPSDFFYQAFMEDGKIVAVDTIPIHRTQLLGVLDPRTPLAQPPDLLPQKVDVTLQELIKKFPNRVQTVLITLRDTVSIPPLPEPWPDYEDSLRSAHQTIQPIKNTRKKEIKNFVKEIEELLNYTPPKKPDIFWLVNGLSIDLPLKYVYDVASWDEVLYIDCRYSTCLYDLSQPTPSAETREAESDGCDLKSDATVKKARELINSDAYRPLSFAERNNGKADSLIYTQIALIDTGVDNTHVLLRDPSRIGMMADCVNPDKNDSCSLSTEDNPLYDPLEACGQTHGTVSAAIITGNDNKGPDYQGVTKYTLDSYRVFPCNSGHLVLDYVATVRALQDAVASLAKVIVVVKGYGEEYHNVVSRAADNAFKFGSIVVAANGNERDKVGSPAQRHRTIGAGAYDANTKDTITYSNQGRGPVYDGRIKPDVQGPTNTVTACGADSALSAFDATSGATPYLGASAALLHSWLYYAQNRAGITARIDPGQVYAQLILAGQNTSFSEETGAGHIVLPPLNGLAWWHQTAILPQGTQNIPLFIDAPDHDTLDAALWWPEDYFQLHNDIELFLVDPHGKVQASSTELLSVFERARVVADSLTPGMWHLKIVGYNVPHSPQTVYWTAHAY